MNFVFGEAESHDAAALVAFLDLVGQETDFTSLDENGILMTEIWKWLFLLKSKRLQITKSLS